eukprot:m.1721 g.1721  ORF g.1721 m.1721 type:complete len:283 (+) comp7754_c0_seq2:163-1011(+)
MCSKEEKALYAEQGFVLLDNIFSEEEMEECCREYDAMFARAHERGDKLEATWKGNWKTDKEKSGKMSLLSIHNIQNHSAIFTRMMLNPKLSDALADLMETNDVQLHHTKAHVKPPHHGSRFPMHQDYQYFPHAKHSMVAVFVHLEDVSVENGCLAVYPGSHKLGPLPDFGSQGYHYVDPEKFPIENAAPVKAKKGQVVIFPYTLVHGSYINVSDQPRRMILFQLRAADDEAVKQIHISPGQGLMLRGTNKEAEASLDLRHLHGKEAVMDEEASGPSPKKAKN